MRWDTMAAMAMAAMADLELPWLCLNMADLEMIYRKHDDFQFFKHIQQIC
jgi:hypothetical protein